MATAKKTRSGKWQIRVGTGEAGKSKCFTANTKKEAEVMAALYLSKSHTPDEEMRLGDALDKYIEQRENIRSPSTVNGYRVIRNNNLGSLANRRLCDISPATMQVFVNDLARDHSPKTVRNVFGLIKSVFAEYCTQTDLSRIALPEEGVRVVTFPEVQDILRVFRGSDVELPVLLALMLGMRASEIRGIRRSNIHDGVLTISGTMLTINGEEVERNRTKTKGSTRRIRLPQRILDLIAELPPEQDLIVTQTHAVIYKHFIKTLKENALPVIRFHDLRHLNASVMLALNVPDKYAMERCGWSSPAIMRGTYQHTFDETRRNIDKIVEDYFESQS